MEEKEKDHKLVAVPPVPESDPDPGYLNAEAILGIDDTQYIEVEVPEWRGTVRLRSMTAAEAVEFVNKARDLGDAESSDILVWIAVRCLVDVQGHRIFTDRATDQLRNRAVAPFMKIQKAALNLNGFTDKGGGIIRAKNDSGKMN